MKQHEIVTKITECGYDELSPEQFKLAQLAREATRSSMAPYSKFHVGAALQLADGNTVTGSNQENAAFTSGTCAERSACFYAGAQYPGVAFERMAIAAWTREGKDQDLPWEACFQIDPISPCGLCRQALLEYESKGGPIELLLCGRDKVFVVDSVASLLPLCFTRF